MGTRFASVLLVIASMISLTAGASLAKSLFSTLGPMGTTVLRLSIAAILLTLFRRSWRFKLNREQWKWTAIYGSMLGLMNFFFYLSIERLPIGLAIGIEFVGPLGVAIYLSRTKTDFLWAFLAMVGIVLVLPFKESQSIDLLGVLFALIAAGFWAAYIFVGKRVGRLVPDANSVAYGMAIGAVLILPLGFRQATELLNNVNLIPVALGVGLLSSAIPYSLEMIALKNVEAKTFGIILSLEPAIGALAAFLMLNEVLTGLQLTAIAFIITASVGSTVMSRPKREILKNEAAAP